MINLGGVRRTMGWVWLWVLVLLLARVLGGGRVWAEQPFLKSELIFKPETWHNHGSCIVETPRGDLLVCWFHGSGERKADDVRIEGARLRRGQGKWSERFVMADTPGYPDTNCAMFIDPQGRLWMFWPTILANLWESSLMKYLISDDYHKPGAPRWSRQEVLHVTPGPEFQAKTEAWVAEVLKRYPAESTQPDLGGKIQTYTDGLKRMAGDKLSQRLGWMTRAHPFVLDGKRLIVPLYSDGFSFSLMAITDDWGATWKTSEPLTGAGNIQPSLVRRRDGSLYTLMRDNGPPPKRLMESSSRDGGFTWSPVVDSQLPNSGTGAEIIGLRSGRWLLINNDLESGRHRLVVQLSEDEGKTWRWKRYLEEDQAGPEQNAYHYPSIIQARDGSIHATYSHFINRRILPRDVDGDPAGKSIKHVHFNEAWIMSAP